MTFTETELDTLGNTLTIDLTTIGRKTGVPRRIEIWWFRVDGRFIITGTPGRRDWLANVRTNPSVTIHVNGLDIPATVTEIDDAELRRSILTSRLTSWFSTQAQLEALVERAPMIELHF